MNSCTARVAPEKAVFRPALPLHVQPEFTGEHAMAKKPYSEQLKHPSWQRKRLEVLEASGWRCQCCEATEKTLHVHHKHYVKGREVWEYDAAELEALCEDCHQEAHESKALIDRIVAQYPSVMWKRLAELLIGFGEEHVDSAEWLSIGELGTARAGQIAWFIGNLKDNEAYEAFQTMQLLAPDGFMDAIRGALDQQLEARGLGPSSQEEGAAE
jgi:hypothetical protein